MHHSAQDLLHHPLVFMCIATPSACALRSHLIHGRCYPFFMRAAVPASRTLLPRFLGRCNPRPTLSILHTHCSILSSSLTLLSLRHAHCYPFFRRTVIPSSRVVLIVIGVVKHQEIILVGFKHLLPFTFAQRCKERLGQGGSGVARGRVLLGGIW